LADEYARILHLAGGLAHEIKNPLSTISLNMELLAEDLAEAQTPRERRARSRIDVVQRECRRLQRLLDDFLNFAKVRPGALEPSDLNGAVAEALDFFATTAEQSHIEVIRYFDPNLPWVMLDREAFHGALLNLVINAQQAMPDGGQLMVRTTTHGPLAAIYLVDTGVGMDERTASRMFEEFFTTKPGGSGLGLPTTAKIIEAHGGRIAVESELGRGTQFTIELPALPRLEAEG
jgi:signal transduction histidine kinase